MNLESNKDNNNYINIVNNINKFKNNETEYNGLILK